MADNSASGATAASAAAAKDDGSQVRGHGLIMKKTHTGQEQAVISTPFGEKAASDLERNIYTKMLNPIMNDMEKTVARSSKILDNINVQMEKERNERVKQNRSAHIPQALKGGGIEPDMVLRKLEQMIYFAEEEGYRGLQLQEHIRLKELEPEAMTSVIASSLKAYLSTLPEPDMKKVVTKINADCQLWLSRLFRFEDACVVYHDDEREGLVRLCRLALFLKYPKYATDGFDALYSRPPVIYMSAAASTELRQYLCLQLGLPLSCVSIVPCNTVFGASTKMDVAMLEKLIQDDIAAAKTPVLLLAYAGTPTGGHVDNVQRLQEICGDKNIWLHLEGSCLATLPLFSDPSHLLATSSGNSITVALGNWLGIPGLPSATLFKASDVTLMHAAGLNTFNTPLKLNCLPYWACLMSFGHNDVVARLTHLCELAHHLYHKLSEIRTIKLISGEKKDVSNTNEKKPLMEILSKTINPLLVFEMTSPTVVFRYQYHTTADDAAATPYVMAQDRRSSDDQRIFFDALNAWLVDNLQTHNFSMVVDTVEVESEGLCLRFCPLETAYAKGTTLEDISLFVKVLSSDLAALDATSRHRKQFENIVASQPNLSLVPLPWAGLGAVRYTPDMYLGKEELSDEDLETIDDINYEMMQQVKNKDTAFSVGETETGSICVKIGLITENTNVADLVEMMQNVGHDIEDSAKFLDNMTDVIRRGIQLANNELQKENDNKLLQEGVLRQIPMVNSMLNWLSPIKEEVKGRSFNLTSGKMASTQDTYKYHMQIQEDTKNGHGGNSAQATETKVTERS